MHIKYTQTCWRSSVLSYLNSAVPCSCMSSCHCQQAIQASSSIERLTAWRPEHKCVQLARLSKHLCFRCNSTYPRRLTDFENIFTYIGRHRYRTPPYVLAHEAFEPRIPLFLQYKHCSARLLWAAAEEVPNIFAQSVIGNCSSAWHFLWATYFWRTCIRKCLLLT